MLFLVTVNKPFDVAILNPPYRKNGDSPERTRLNRLGMGTSNLYAAFVWLALDPPEWWRDSSDHSAQFHRTELTSVRSGRP